MTKLGLFTSAFALLLAIACNDDGPSTETGSETQNATETTAEGDGDGDNGCTPPGVYGDCANGGLDACMAESLPQCLQDDPNMPSIGVCGRACDDVCDCWAAPATGNAPVTCRSLVEGDDGTCVLDCAGGETCPDGMSCLDALDICVFSVN
jgi:hypothetical protein